MSMLSMFSKYLKRETCHLFLSLTPRWDWPLFACHFYCLSLFCSDWTNFVTYFFDFESFVFFCHLWFNLSNLDISWFLWFNLVRSSRQIDARDWIQLGWRLGQLGSVSIRPGGSLFIDFHWCSLYGDTILRRFLFLDHRIWSIYINLIWYFGKSIRIRYWHIFNRLLLSEVVATMTQNRPRCMVVKIWIPCTLQHTTELKHQWPGSSNSRWWVEC